MLKMVHKSLASLQGVAGAPVFELFDENFAVVFLIVKVDLLCSF